MAENIASGREYYDEIASLAADIVKEAEGDRETAFDRAHETVDGHQWIIYTRYNAQVLDHSSNESAHFDNFGPLEADSYSDAMAKMAYAAMLQDLQEAIETALEEYEPDSDSEG